MSKRFFIRFLFSTVLMLIALVTLPALDPTIALLQDEINWIQNHGPLRVSNELNWAPFNFSERGTPTGYSIDCINLAAEKLDLEIEFITGPEWTEFLEMLNRGEIDVILNIAITPERSENMIFTTPYSQFSLALFTRTGTLGIDSFQSLSGMTIAVPEEYWLEEILKDYPDINVLTVDDTEGAIQAVSSGRADALYESMPVVQYLSKRLFITNLQVGGTLDIENGERIYLHMAVNKDQEILRSILNKGLSAISPAEFTKIRNKWIDSGKVIPVTEQDSEFNIQYPILVIIAGLILVFGLSFSLRRIITKVKILNFRSIWLFSMISLSVFIALVALLGWITISRTNRSLREDLMDSMTVVLEATEQSLYVWIENNLQMVKRDSENINIRNLTENILASDADSTEETAAFRSYIIGSLRWLNEEMYQVIRLDSTVLVSNYPNLEGKVSALSTQAGERLRRAFSGESLFIPTFNASVDEEETDPKMFFVSPIRDQEGRIVAVLARAEDPSQDFSKLVAMGHPGRSGETYAFDSKGLMISPSRFEGQIAQTGLIPGNQSSILNLQIRDPGVNLMESDVAPSDIQNLGLTYMASQAILGISGQSIKGYRDYRGVPVFGVWHWETRHGFGIATETDVEEGLESFYIIRDSIIITLSVTVLLAVLVTLVSLIFGEKANQSLNESRADLENRVSERTNELSKANRNLNNTIEALTHPFYVIDIKTHRIILANKAALESGREGASTCYSLTHFIDRPCDGSEHQCPMVELLKTKQPVQVEHIHTDNNGITHHAEVHGYPILDENDEVVQMIEYSLNITDRKKAEETTKKHLEELELFNTVTIGREEKMIELKIEINELHRLLNLPEKYVIVTGNEEMDGILKGELDNE